jgi:protein SCO1/2
MKPQHLALVVLLGLVLSMLGARTLLMNASHHAPTRPERAEAVVESKHTLEPMWPAPQFAYTDQRGGRVTKQSLEGKPWVANFVFTTCRTVCPLLTAKMVQLQRKLPGLGVRFISFSVDPEHDTVEALAQYAMHWAPDEARWSLLATDAQSLPALAEAFRVTAEKNADKNAVDPIIHSSVFVLVDGQGVVRGVYDSERREDFLALVADTRKLAEAKAPAVARAPRDGPTLYRELSCGGCHDRAELAPPLGGLLGKRRELGNGIAVEADLKYLRESILSPDAKRVAGYTLKMPTYDGVLEGAELDTLLGYVAALPETAPADAPKEEEDPVCHMSVSVVADTPEVVVNAKRYHFCSQACRDRFAAAPDQFAKQ